MENINIKKGVDAVMELYRKMGTLNGLSDDEIQKIREKEERRQLKIHMRFEEFSKENSDNNK